jgi:nicotinamidase-related amidase
MQLNAKSTALILIDLQKGVLGMPVQPHPAAQIYERSMALAGRLRNAGGLIVHVRVSFYPGFADALNLASEQPTAYKSLPPGWDEFPEPIPSSDVVITKRQWGAFYGTDLDLQLRRRGMRCIVLGGIATNIGVESTARSAMEHGYEQIFVEDLCSSVNAEMHAFSFKYIFPRMGQVGNSADLEIV